MDSGLLDEFIADIQSYVSPYRSLSGVPWPDETSHSVQLPDACPYTEPTSKSPQQLSAEIEPAADLSLPSGTADPPSSACSQSETPKSHRTPLPMFSSPATAQTPPTPSLTTDMSPPSLAKPLTKRPGAIPPELPPSVEAAYRKKCIQLKQRMNEVEEANDASRQRLARINRSIQKLRLERAFLLEQLAKRTSTNVEDSEGSPSPPPTPKEKPLRTKRGHRKPDFLTTDIGDGRTSTSFIQQGPVTLSPSSDAFSHTHPDPSQSLRNSTPQAQPSKRQLPSNGTHATPTTNSLSTPSQPRRLKNAFDLYCNENRPTLASENQKEIAEGTYDIERVLATGWSSLSSVPKADYMNRYEQIKKQADVEKDASKSTGPRQTVFDAATRHVDEDVEMGEDAEDAGSPSAAGEGGGFTAVNRT